MMSERKSIDEWNKEIVHMVRAQDTVAFAAIIEAERASREEAELGRHLTLHAAATGCCVVAAGRSGWVREAWLMAARTLGKVNETPLDEGLVRAALIAKILTTLRTQVAS